MNNNQLIDFNGEKLKIEDILKEKNKVILLNLYIKTHDLEKTIKSVCGKVDGINTKIDNQWKNIGRNKSMIGYIKGVLFVIIPVILGIVSYLALK